MSNLRSRPEMLARFIPCQLQPTRAASVHGDYGEGEGEDDGGVSIIKRRRLQFDLEIRSIDSRSFNSFVFLVIKRYRLKTMVGFLKSSLTNYFAGERGGRERRRRCNERDFPSVSRLFTTSNNLTRLAVM